MPAPRPSNRFAGYSILFAALGLGTLYLFVLKPAQDEMRLAKKRGVISPEEAVPTPEDERHSAKIARRVQLRKAIERNDAEAIQTMLSQGNEVDSNIGGMTPLLLAAQLGQTEILQKLITAGASMERTDTDGNTALLYAARFGQNEAVEILLQHGANLSAQNRYEANALDCAVLSQNRKLYERLKARGLKADLQQAIFINDAETITRLLAQGADINAFHASKKAQEEVTARLKQQTYSTGVSLTAAQQMFTLPYGFQTPLDTALSRHHWQTAETLLARGADIDSRDIYGSTALMKALWSKDDAPLKFLLQHNARTDIKDRSGHDVFDTIKMMPSPQRAKVEQVFRACGTEMPSR